MALVTSQNKAMVMLWHNCYYCPMNLMQDKWQKYILFVYEASRVDNISN